MYHLSATDVSMTNGVGADVASSSTGSLLGWACAAPGVSPDSGGPGFIDRDPCE
jgi:hypothetical protein